MNLYLIFIVISCEQVYVWEGYGDVVEVFLDFFFLDLFVCVYEKMDLVIGYSLGDLCYDL